MAGYQKQKKKNSGLTLIETILYIALLSFFISAVIPMFIDLNLWQSAQNQQASELGEFLFVGAKIEDMLRHAEAIATPAIGETSEELSLRTTEGDHFSFSVMGGVLTLKKENELIPLHDKNVLVEGVFFHRPQTQDTFEKIEMSLHISGHFISTTTIPFDPT